MIILLKHVFIEGKDDMEFIIQKENLINCLNMTTRVTASKPIQPVLSNVLIETISENKVKFTATDLDISIEAELPATIVKEGKITLPAKKIRDITSKLPDSPISFHLSENNQVKITCGKSKFDLYGISADEFPEIEHPETDEFITINSKAFLKCIKQTVYAAAVYDTNNVLSGVSLDIKDNIIEMAATDGSRLARCREKIDGKLNQNSVIIPSRTLNELSGVIQAGDSQDLMIGIKNSQIIFKLGSIILSSRLIEGSYPKYGQLIPNTSDKTVLIDKDDFISSLELTSTMANERTNIVRLTFNNDTIELKADTPDLGDSTDIVSIDYKEDEFKIAFNYKYLLDSLKVIDTAKIKMEMNGSLAAVLIKPEDDDNYLSLIMPVQVR